MQQIAMGKSLVLKSFCWQPLQGLLVRADVAGLTASYAASCCEGMHLFA